MKAVILFTGTGPILFLTSYNSLNNPKFIEKLAGKGFKKFIAYEVSDELVKQRYGNHYDVVMGDLYQDDDMRVIDFDGHHIYNLFSFKELGEPIFQEPS